MRETATAFVTGGTGFVGSHLVEELLRRGYSEIRCLVRTRLRWLEGLDIVPIHGSLFDDDLIRHALDGVDFVYHVGAITRSLDWADFERENVEATLCLLDAVADAAPGVRSVLVTSSLAAVGACEGGIADEDSPLRPISNYGRSKAQMERAIHTARGGRPAYTDQLPIVVIRPSSVYGPREADIYTMFKAAQRGVFPLMGRGSEPDISLVHVHDVVRGMVDAAELTTTAGNTYFLGSDSFYSWREVHQAMRQVLGRPSIGIPVPHALTGVVGAASEFAGRMLGNYPPLNREKAREARYACKMCRIDRARNDFGYSPRIPLAEGFRETVAWYRTHGWL